MTDDRMLTTPGDDDPPVSEAVLDSLIHSLCEPDPQRAPADDQSSALATTLTPRARQMKDFESLLLVVHVDARQHEEKGGSIVRVHEPMWRLFEEGISQERLRQPEYINRALRRSLTAKSFQLSIPTAFGSMAERYQWSSAADQPPSISATTRAATKELWTRFVDFAAKNAPLSSMATVASRVLAVESNTVYAKLRSRKNPVLSTEEVNSLREQSAQILAEDHDLG